MRTTLARVGLTVYELLPDEELVVYRIVRSDIAEDPVLINSFKSHYEMREPPRKVERTSTVLHMGVSVFSSRDAAFGVAARFPRLGGFVARLSLGYGQGVNYAYTGLTSHLTLWADPVKLHAQIVDIDTV